LFTRSWYRDSVSFWVTLTGMNRTRIGSTVHRWYGEIVSSRIFHSSHITNPQPVHVSQDPDQTGHFIP
jgi:hypothetical protein